MENDTKTTWAFLIMVLCAIGLFGGVLMLWGVLVTSGWYVLGALLAASVIELGIAWILERAFNIR